MKRFWFLVVGSVFAGFGSSLLMFNGCNVSLLPLLFIFAGGIISSKYVFRKEDVKK